MEPAEDFQAEVDDKKGVGQGDIVTVGVGGVVAGDGAGGGAGAAVRLE